MSKRTDKMVFENSLIELEKSQGDLLNIAPYLEANIRDRLFFTVRTINTLRKGLEEICSRMK